VQLLREFFKKNAEFRKYTYILCVVFLSIIFFRWTENVKFENIFPVIFGVLSPFIYGTILAYILNVPTRFLELLLKKIPLLGKKEHACKVISIAVAFFLLIGLILCIVGYIIPELTSSAQSLGAFLLKIESGDVEKFLQNTAKRFNLTINDEMYSYILSSINELINAVMASLKNMPGMFSSVMTQAMSIASSIYNLVMSLIISIYILLDKKNLSKYVGKIFYCFMDRRRALILAGFAEHCNDVFESFFVGKLVDSIIIAVMFFAGAVILRLPYALFFSLIIGITNMIPYFGPVIGGVPVVLLTLIYSPIKGFWVLIFIILLQQFDGVVLGPKILGKSIGVKPLGVIFAIIVGGAIAGPIGMFFGVPVFSVISEIVTDIVEKNYRAKSIRSHENADTGKKRQRHPQKYESSTFSLSLATKLDKGMDLFKIKECSKEESEKQIATVGHRKRNFFEKDNSKKNNNTRKGTAKNNVGKADNTKNNGGKNNNNKKDNNITANKKED
jgi:predicted PurR-regulated permease PerM